VNARRSPNFASFAVAASAPEGAFLELGQATIITPLKQAQRTPA
jgi:hypothetical protein